MGAGPHPCNRYISCDEKTENGDARSDGLPSEPQDTNLFESPALHIPPVLTLLFGPLDKSGRQVIDNVAVLRENVRRKQRALHKLPTAFEP